MKIHSNLFSLEIKWDQRLLVLIIIMTLKMSLITLIQLVSMLLLKTLMKRASDFNKLNRVKIIDNLNRRKMAMNMILKMYQRHQSHSTSITDLNGTLRWKRKMDMSMTPRMFQNSHSLWKSTTDQIGLFRLVLITKMIQKIYLMIHSLIKTWIM